MTKKQAIAKAKALRQEGKNVKVVFVKGINTIPGKGIACFARYEIRYA